MVAEPHIRETALQLHTDIDMCDILFYLIVSSNPIE